MNTRQPYPTDLTDEQWARVEPYLPADASGGRPREIPLREILDAYWYILRAGCAWRLLPHDFPKWQTVYSQIRRWKVAGVWEALHARVRDDLRLEAEGRQTEPSAAALAYTFQQSAAANLKPGELPPDSPKIITLPGSPPNCAMLSRTH